MARSRKGVEPVQGKVPTKDLFYRLPAASLLPGLVLSFETLDALPLVLAAERVPVKGEAPELKGSQASSAGPHPPEALARWGLCFLHLFQKPGFRRSQWGYFFLEGLNFEFCVD